jgi:hypothetical protein
MKRPITLIDVTRWFVVAVGALLYIFLIALGLIDFNQQPLASEPFWHRLGILIEFTILGSGLAPLLIAMYFLGVCKTRKAWLVGAFLLPLFLVAHYVTAVFMAHGPAAIHIPMIVVELAAAIAAIWIWEIKFRRKSTQQAL